MAKRTAPMLTDLLNVSRETMQRLESFEQLFRQWSPKINLVSASTKDDFWNRHIIDSAQLLSLKPGMKQVVDLGSGGGFPGVVLAILLNDMDERRVDLIESNRKKTAFLQTVRAQCAPCAQIHARRIEDILPQLPVADCITARALAPLPKLLELAQSHLTKGATGLFHKGRGFMAELEESRANWRFDLIKHPSEIDAESVILEIHNLSRISN